MDYIYSEFSTYYLWIKHNKSTSDPYLVFVFRETLKSVLIEALIKVLELLSSNLEIATQ